MSHFDEMKKFTKHSKKYNIGRKLMLSLMMMLICATALILCDNDVYAYSADDYTYLLGTDGTLVSEETKLSDNSQKDGQLTTSLNGVTENVNYYYASDGTAYKLLYYTWQETKDTEVEGAPVAVYAPVSALNIPAPSGQAYFDNNIEYNYYNIFSFSPNYVNNGTKYIDQNQINDDGSKSALFQNIANGDYTTTDYIDAYYKYDQIDTTKYFNTNAVSSIDIVYVYEDGSEVSFDNIAISDYYKYFVDKINAKELKYDLYVESPQKALTYIDENGNSYTYGTDEWSSEYETSYYANNLLYIWQEDEKCFYTYNVKDLEELGYLKESEVQALTENENSSKESIALLDSNSIVVMVKRNKTLIETSYAIAQASQTAQTVYVKSLSELKDLNSASESVVYTNISDVPNAYDLQFTYVFNYYNDTVQHLYKTDYAQQLYNYTEQTTNYSQNAVQNATLNSVGSSSGYNLGGSNYVLLTEANVKNYGYDTNKIFYQKESNDNSLKITQMPSNVTTSVNAYNGSTTSSSSNYVTDSVTANSVTLYNTNKADYETLSLYNYNSTYYKDKTSYAVTSYSTTATKSAYQKNSETVTYNNQSLSSFADKRSNILALSNTTDSVSYYDSSTKKEVYDNYQNLGSYTYAYKSSPSSSAYYSSYEDDSYDNDGNVMSYTTAGSEIKNVYPSVSAGESACKSSKSSFYVPELYSTFYRYTHYKYTYYAKFTISGGNQVSSKTVYIPVSYLKDNFNTTLSSSTVFDLKGYAVSQSSSYSYYTANMQSVFQNSYMPVYATSYESWGTKYKVYAYDYKTATSTLIHSGKAEGNTNSSVKITYNGLETYSSNSWYTYEWGNTSYYTSYETQGSLNGNAVHFAYYQNYYSKSPQFYEYKLIEYRYCSHYEVNKITWKKTEYNNSTTTVYRFNGTNYSKNGNTYTTVDSSANTYYYRGANYSGHYYSSSSNTLPYLPSNLSESLLLNYGTIKYKNTSSSAPTAYQYSNKISIEKYNDYVVIDVSNFDVSYNVGSEYNGSINNFINEIKNKCGNSSTYTFTYTSKEGTPLLINNQYTIKIAKTNEPKCYTEMVVQQKATISKKKWGSINSSYDSNPTVTSSTETPITESETTQVTEANGIKEIENTFKNSEYIFDNGSVSLNNGVYTFTKNGKKTGYVVNHIYNSRTNGEIITLYNINTSPSLTNANSFLSAGKYSGSTNSNIATAGTQSLTKYTASSTGVTYLPISTTYMNTYTDAVRREFVITFSKQNSNNVNVNDASSQYYYLNQGQILDKDNEYSDVLSKLYDPASRITDCYEYVGATYTSSAFYTATKNVTKFTSNSSNSTLNYGDSSNNLTKTADNVEYGKYTNATISSDGTLTSGNYQVVTNANFTTKSKNIFDQVAWFKQLQHSGLIKSIEDSYFKLQNTTASNITFSLSDFAGSTSTTYTYQTKEGTVNSNTVTIPANSTVYLKNIMGSTTSDLTYTPYVSLKVGSDINEELYRKSSLLTKQNEFVKYANYLSNTDLNKFNGLTNSLSIKTQIVGYQGVDSVTDNVSLVEYAQENSIDISKIVMSLSYVKDGNTVVIANQIPFSSFLNEYLYNETINDNASTSDNNSLNYKFVLSSTKSNLYYKKTRNYELTVATATTYNPQEDLATTDKIEGNLFDSISASDSVTPSNVNGGYKNLMYDVYTNSYYNISTTYGKKLALQEYGNRNVEKDYGNWQFYYNNSTFYRINKGGADFYKYAMSIDVNKSEKLTEDGNMHVKLESGFINEVSNVDGTIKYLRISNVNGVVSPITYTLSEEQYQTIATEMDIADYETQYLSATTVSSNGSGYNYYLQNGKIMVSSNDGTAQLSSNEYKFLIPENATFNNLYDANDNFAFMLKKVEGQNFEEYKLYYTRGYFGQKDLEIKSEVSNCNENGTSCNIRYYYQIENEDGTTKEINMFKENNFYYIETTENFGIDASGNWTNEPVYSLKDVSSFITATNQLDNTYSSSQIKLKDVFIIQADNVPVYKLYHNAKKSLVINDIDDIYILDAGQYNSNSLASTGTYRLRFYDGLPSDNNGFYPTSSYTLTQLSSDTKKEVEINQYLWSNNKPYQLKTIVDENGIQYDFHEDMTELKEYLLTYLGTFETNNIDLMSLTSQFYGQILNGNDNGFQDWWDNYYKTAIMGWMADGFDENTQIVGTVKYVNGEGADIDPLFNTDMYSLLAFSQALNSNEELASLFEALDSKTQTTFTDTLSFQASHLKYYYRMLSNKYKTKTRSTIPSDNYFHYLFDGENPRSIFNKYAITGIPFIPDKTVYLIDAEKLSALYQMVMNYGGTNSVKNYGSSYAILNCGEEKLIYQSLDTDTLVQQYVRTEDNYAYCGDTTSSELPLVLSTSDEYSNNHFNVFSNAFSRPYYKYDITEQLSGVNIADEGDIHLYTRYYFATAISSPEREHYYNFMNKSAGTTDETRNTQEIVNGYDLSFVNKGNSSVLEFAQKYFKNVAFNKNFNFISNGKDIEFYKKRLISYADSNEETDAVESYTKANQISNFYTTETAIDGSLITYINDEYVDNLYVSINNIFYEKVAQNSTYNDYTIPELYQNGYLYVKTTTYETDNIGQFIYRSLPEHNVYFYSESKYDYLQASMGATSNAVDEWSSGEIEGKLSTTDTKTFYFIAETQSDGKTQKYYMPTIKYNDAYQRVEETKIPDTNFTAGSITNNSMAFKEAVSDWDFQRMFTLTFKGTDLTTVFRGADAWGCEIRDFHQEVSLASMDIEPGLFAFWDLIGTSISSGFATHVMAEDYSLYGNGWISIDVSKTAQIAGNEISPISKMALQQNGYYNVSYQLSQVDKLAPDGTMSATQTDRAVLNSSNYKEAPYFFNKTSTSKKTNNYYIQTSSQLIPIDDYNIGNYFFYNSKEKIVYYYSSISALSGDLYFYFNEIYNLEVCANVDNIYFGEGINTGKILDVNSSDKFGSFENITRVTVTQLEDYDISDNDYFKNYNFRNNFSINTSSTSDFTGAGLFDVNIINEGTDANPNEDETSFTLEMDFARNTAYIYQLSFTLSDANAVCPINYYKHTANGVTKCYYNGVDTENFVTTNSILKDITLADKNTNKLVYYNIVYNFDSPTIKVNNLAGSANYELQLFNMFGQHQRTINFATSPDLVYNPYGTFFQDETNATLLDTGEITNNAMLKDAYISKTLRQCILSNGSETYCTEPNGTIYTISEQFRVKLEKSIDTVSYLNLKILNENKPIANTGTKVTFTPIDDSYEDIDGANGLSMNSDGSIKIKLSSLMIKKLRTYSEKYPQEEGTNVSQKALQEFVQQEIVSKYALKLSSLNNGSFGKTVSIQASLTYTSEKIFLDLNQNNILDIGIIDETGIYKYRDLKGAEIKSEGQVAFEPNTVIGNYLCSEDLFTFITNYDTNIQMPRQDDPSVVYGQNFVFIKQNGLYVLCAYTDKGKPVIIG